MSGIEAIPDRIDDEGELYLTGTAAVEAMERRHIDAEEGIKKEKGNIDLINQRAAALIWAYDEYVLGGYSREKDDRYFEELRHTCIPCFVELPEDQEPHIKLDWALRRVNSHRSMAFIDILDEAGGLEGEVGERFFYLLRYEFLGHLGAVNKNYSYSENNPIGDPPPESEDDDPSVEEEAWYDLRDFKEGLLGSMANTRVRFQLMANLTERRLKRESYG